MEHLRCVVERITYQNEDNGYTVLKCAVKNYNDLVTVVGTMPDTEKSFVYRCDKSKENIGSCRREKSSILCD